MNLSKNLVNRSLLRFRHGKHDGSRTWSLRTIVAAALLLSLSMVISTAQSQGRDGYWYHVRSIEASQLGVTAPRAITYDDRSETLAVVGQNARGKADKIVSFNLSEDVIFSRTLDTSAAPSETPLLFPHDGQLVLLDRSTKEFEVIAGTAENPAITPAAFSRELNARGVGSAMVIGLAYDPASHMMYLLDSKGPALLRIRVDPSDPVSPTTTRRIRLRSLVDVELLALAYNPNNDHLYVLSPANSTIYELTQTGRVVATRDITELGLSNPQSMVFAPSGDSTDDPSIMNLYIADSGEQVPANGSGRVVELSLISPVINAPVATDAAYEYVRSIDTSIWSPPSPDPAGIDFHPGLNQLIVSDSEVEEMSIYQGVNIYHASTTGTLISTCDTTDYSVEPTGVAANPDTGGFLTSNDNADEIFQVVPGPDGQLCTVDDILTSFDTRAFGSDDPEGVAYGDGVVMVSDGVNREVYVIRPGPDGVFGSADDTVTHFDTASMGLNDPEGIGYHWTRKTLFIVSRTEDLLVESDLNGTILNVFDLSAVNIFYPAGVGIGPSSVTPGRYAAYISQRGEDNNYDPNENDGKIYEIVLLIGDPGPIDTPTPTSTNTPGPSPTPSNTPLPTNTPTITPTPTPGPASTVFNPIDDASIELANPDTNYGTATTLLVDGSPIRNSLLKFNVAGVSGTIVGARLRLFNVNDSNAGGQFYPTGNTWEEETVTWMTAPPAGTPLLGSLGSVIVGNWYEVDVSGYVNGNGTYSIRLTEGASTNGADYSSKEAGVTLAPQLVVQFYDTGAPTPTFTPVPPTPTNTPVPPSPTFTPVPPTPTSTPVPPTPTNTPIPPTPTNTPVGPTSTSTPVPPSPTNTPVPPTSTSTPVPPTPTNTPVPSSGAIYISLANGGSYAVGSVTGVRDEDIITYDGSSWSMLFDGSDVGVGGTDLNAFEIVDADTILMSFSSSVTVGGLAIQDHDIVRFDATSLGVNTTGAFYMYFDGEDVGLTDAGEDIDSLDLLPDGRLIVSTTGSPTVTGVSGGRDEDLLAFTPSTLGTTTNGSWALYFDGSDVLLSGATDVDAADISADGRIYLSTLANFNVSTVSGTDDDIFVCVPTSLGMVTACDYESSLAFDGSVWELGDNDVDGVDFSSSTGPTLPDPTATPTASPEATPTGQPLTGAIYISLLDSGSFTLGDVANVRDEDIVFYDGNGWSMVFDGSDVGVGGTDLNAFEIIDADTILMSFSSPVTVGGLAIQDHDIVQFDATSLGVNTAGVFSIFFDGEDAQLTTSGEDIDGFSLLSDGRLIISTTGSPGVTGVIGARDEDLLAFTPSTLGTATSGSWALYFDGSDVSLYGATDVDAVDIDDGRIYLSTLANFNVATVSGGDDDIFVCVPSSLGSVTTCAYDPTLAFDGSVWGLNSKDVDGIDVP